MGANVFANSREISGKASSNKSMAAMPDVCLSPPSPPAGPIPIPYPNFSQASDTSSGSKKVKIAGKEVGLKNSSNYKKSKGDMAATRSFGMGLVTHTLEGKTKHAAWSFDVKFENKNVIRHLDLTTHNHVNMPNTVDMTVDIGGMLVQLVGDPECVGLEAKLLTAENQDTRTGKVGKDEVLAVAHHSEQGFMKKAASENMMRKNIKSGKKSGYLERPERDIVDKKTSEPKIACTDKTYSDYTNNSGHAEGKIIQKLFEKTEPNGKLTMRIKWNNDGTMRDEPCGDCKNAICQTVQECGVEIYLCMQDPEDKRDPAPIQKVKAPCHTTTDRAKKPGEHSWEKRKLQFPLS